MLNGALDQGRQYDRPDYGVAAMGMIALSMFVGLWIYGQEMFGWTDANGDIKVAIFVTFVLGVICGYRVKD